MFDLENYIDSHLDEPLTCEMIAEHFYYHQNYLNKLVRNARGISLHRFIMQRKIEFSKTLLGRYELSVTQIAHMLCFFDTSHFTRTFSAFTGTTPLQYRNALPDP